MVLRKGYVAVRRGVSAENQNAFFKVPDDANSVGIIERVGFDPAGTEITSFEEHFNLKTGDKVVFLTNYTQVNVKGQVLLVMKEENVIAKLD